MLMSGSFTLSGQGSCHGEDLLQHPRLAHRTQYAVIVQVSGHLQFPAVHKERAQPLTPKSVLCVCSALLALMLVFDRVPELRCRSLGTCTFQQCTDSARGHSCL